MYIKCPDSLSIEYTEKLIVFMAGGITGCPNWQDEISKKVKSDIILVNPRRDDFDCSKAESSVEQIKWEYDHLQKADWIFFWFPKEGACVITLFELGWAIGSNKSIRVGVEPGYSRELDVKTQLGLRRAQLTVYDSLEKLYAPIIDVENLNG